MAHFGYEPSGEGPPASVLALDVNETLSDMSPLGPRLEEVGVSADFLGTWFASTLRDGFGLTLAGAYADFATLAHATLCSLFVGVKTLVCDPDEAAARVVSGIGELPLHADVRPGLQSLRAAGIRLITLTNGSPAAAQRLLSRGGVDGYIEEFLSVEEVRRWKPAPEPYRFAAARAGVPMGEVMLAAVHPWDIDGAKRAGLTAAWINRDGIRYPGHFSHPDLTCSDFRTLADALIEQRGTSR